MISIGIPGAIFNASIRVLRSAMGALGLAVVFLSVMTTEAARSDDLQTSRLALLSPQISQGQKLTWRGRITTKAYHNRNTGAHVPAGSYLDENVCTLVRHDSTGFTFSRQLRVSLSGEWSPPRSLPPMILRNGRTLKADQSPLNDDRICKIYSIVRLGTPPSNLHVGASWPLVRLSDIGNQQKRLGRTTVTKIDSLSNTISLRATIRLASEPRPFLVEDLVITRGGLILSEIDRISNGADSASTSPTESPDQVDTWHLDP